MFRLIKIKDPTMKWKFLAEIKPETDCFIVSDIKTKLSMESELLKKHNFLPGFCVMRINEFYKEIFNLMDLDWSLNSDAFVRELFSEFCVKHKEPWMENLQDSKKIFRFFNAFLPVFFHRESFDVFAEWFYKKHKTIIWRSWFNLCHEFFNVLKLKKVLHESGLKAFLFHCLPSLSHLPFKKERMFLDLSFSFDFCEKEIFKELSRHKEIFILSPDLEKELFVKPSFNVYKMLEKEMGGELNGFFCSDLEKEKNIQKLPSSQIFQIQSKTRLEELKKAVVQVCKWIEAGVSLEDIVIFAPDMEEYWFALKTYFEREKIPVKKAVLAKVIDFPSVGYFLSALRLHLGYSSFENLECFSFSKESKTDFSKFQAYYFNVPDRSLAKKLLFKDKTRLPYGKITGRQFVEWALLFWPKEAPFFLLEAVLKVFLKIPMEGLLENSAWLRLFESELRTLEIELKGEDNRGIFCLSFNAFYSFKKPYVFIMGLDEESLKPPSLAFLNESERRSILDDLGFPLPISPPKERENSLLWFLQSSELKEVYLSFSSCDFKGSFKASSLLYLLLEPLFSARKKEIREGLLWDCKKKQNCIDKILSHSLMEEERKKALKNVFQNKKQVFFHREKLQLSPSRLKTYRECPFKYSAEKLLFVKEGTFIERELSPSLKGNIAHNLFEKTLKTYPNLQPEEEEIEEIIKEIKPEDEKLIYEKQWLLSKEELKSLLSSFLEKEREYRNTISSLEPKLFELEYLACWDQKKGELNSDGDYLFTARIDRIDRERATGAYVIRDYKATAKGLTHISSWVKKDKEELQLVFYAQALQKGLIQDVPRGPVSALFYSIYKDDFSAKGFVEKDSPFENLLGENLKGHNKDKDFLSQAIEKSNKRVQSLVQLMEEGHFSPKPKDRGICKKCSYRTWCRVETLLKQ